MSDASVWSTNLVNIPVYVHRLPCRCSSGSHREGTMSVHTMGHDVGNPYSKGGGVGRGGPLRCEASPKALALVVLALRSPGFSCYNGRILVTSSGRIPCRLSNKRTTPL